MATSRTHKIVGTLLVGLLITVSAVGTFPQKSYAVIPVQETGLSLVANIASKVSNAISAHASAALATKEYALDPLAYMVAKVALQSVTRGVVNWINSGFNGSPAFVQDLKGELLRVGDTQALSLINNYRSSGSLTNLPWRDEISQAVLTNYFRSTSKDGFVLNNPYSLDKVAKDPVAFANGDYSKGGLDAYMSQILNPGDNPLATYFNLENNVNNGIADKQGQKQTELNWGNGYSAYRGDCGSASSVTSLTAVDACANKLIKTPGHLIANAANKYLVDSGLDQYVSADEISEVVTNLLGQLVNNVIGGGGLSGVSKPSSGGGSSYISRATDPTALTQAASAQNVSATFLTTVSNQAQQLQGYQANWQTISDAASNAKTLLLKSTCSPSASTIIATQIDPVLARAATAIGNASSALSALDKIRADLTANVSTSPSDQETAVSNASQAFATLQTQLATTIPVSAITEAQVQSQDSTGTDGTTSLYTQMSQIATQATCSP